MAIWNVSGKSIKVERGDTLSHIVRDSRFASYISGNTADAKIKTIKDANGLKDVDKIYVNQILYVAKQSSSGSSTTTTTPKLTINGFGLKSDSFTGREMIVNWTWKYANTAYKNTAGYTYEWYQWLNNKWNVNQTNLEHPEDAYCQSTFSADEDATKVYFRVRPFYKNNNEIKYWNAVGWTNSTEYEFINNPPDKPPAPTVELKDLTLTISYTNIDAEVLGAKWVKFEVVKDNKTTIHTSGLIPINTTSNTVSYQYTVAEGATYTVRARSVSTKKLESGWSEFSGEIQTRPTAPSGAPTAERRKRSDGTYSVYLQWAKSENATKYQVEYVTTKSDFETAPGTIQTATTANENAYLELTNLYLGSTYYFRVRAIWGDQGSNLSEPSGIVELPLGKAPGVPTTWSSSGSTFVGKTMEFGWAHNATDGSKQTSAVLSLSVDGGMTFEEFTFENPTAYDVGGLKKEMPFTYGTAVSYEGSLYVKIDTNNADLVDKKIVWKVKTAGITIDSSGKPEYSPWSIERTVYIYTQPELHLTVPDEVDSFPFIIGISVAISNNSVQWPIGYHLRILHKGSPYETVDDIGRTVLVNRGDVVYSEYLAFSNNAESINVTITPDLVNLYSGREYEVRCSADMSTGLSVTSSVPFTPVFGYTSYTINADIVINKDTYTALITPYTSGDNAELAVYRREYDGSFTNIASYIPNNGTSVTDPHPALDYARYRIVAKDSASGSISFWDAPPQPVNGSAVLIQWEEEWQSYDSDGPSAAGASWSGSMLKLPYNIDITDKRKREVELVKYAGREHPVSYYGTHRDESSTWNVVIPATDKETVYGLRRLSMWSGDVYVREPSGLGYWANITVSFDVKHKDVVIPVTLEVTRVEGGA